MRCVLCGRHLTTPAACFNYGPLRGEPVGPKCARKAGLLERAKKRQGAVRLFDAVRRAPADPKTMDLFEEAA